MAPLIPCPSGIIFLWVVNRCGFRSSQCDLLVVVYLVLLVSLGRMDGSICGFERGLLSPGLKKILTVIYVGDFLIVIWRRGKWYYVFLYIGKVFRLIINKVLQTFFLLGCEIFILVFWISDIVDGGLRVCHERGVDLMVRIVCSKIYLGSIV